MRAGPDRAPRASERAASGLPEVQTSAFKMTSVKTTHVRSARLTSGPRFFMPDFASTEVSPAKSAARMAWIFHGSMSIPAIRVRRALSQARATAALGFLRGAAALVGPARLPLAELAGEFVHDQIERGVKLLRRFVGVNVGTGDGEVDLDRVAVVGLGDLVVNEDHMRGEDFAGQRFEMGDLFRDVEMDRTGESNMTGAEMDLHVGLLLHERGAVGNAIRGECV